MRRKKLTNEDTWAPIQESLDAFQPAHLAARLREYLVDAPTRRARLEGVDALLAEHAGAWYTKADVRLGDECLGQGQAPDADVEGHIQRILSALGEAHAWLCTLDTYFRSLALPLDETDRTAVLSDAVRRVIALTAEARGGAGAWAHPAHLALGWLLESQGIRRTERVERALREALADFGSGSPPTAEQARRAANTIALAAVKVDVPLRYREEEVS
ncbi:hypothetical protein JQX13_24220 [Archangium violaceum]|uniref:hypothetical protein n=1 Tax=Archangium violaceum TaxID=83451 RepID=UPI00193C2711|nr:hypothetical protein [Archangium violaceum]QRK12863.1 hypothetical protein JQX13_24220 [Archangium violaceum]